MASAAAPTALEPPLAERSWLAIGTGALFGLAILALGLAALPDWILATTPATRPLGRRRYELFSVGSGALVVLILGLLLNGST